MTGSLLSLFMWVCGLFQFKNGCAITDIPALRVIYKVKRSFRLIFKAGNSAVLRLPLFFPVVGTVKVSGRYIDGLTKAPNGLISNPQDTKGGSAPFFKAAPAITRVLIRK
jgi:hypothetical protein